MTVVGPFPICFMVPGEVEMRVRMDLLDRRAESFTDVWAAWRRRESLGNGKGLELVQRLSGMER